MNVSPISNIGSLQQKYLNEVPPANLAVLAKPKRNLPPASTEGVGLPPETISPKGIYDETGKLPTVKGSGLDFMAYA